jgi:hypothetical protein
MKLRTIVLFLIIAVPLQAQDSPQSKVLKDPLLEKLIGDWNVQRTFGSGRVAKNLVHGEWVLQHQFVELRYRDSETPPHYEAIVLIGYDNVAKHYICHWADIFGGDYSTDGFAPRDGASNMMEFRFEFHDGQLTNRFAFDPESDTWKSTIRQIEKGEWKLFCEDKFTRTGHERGKQ